MQTYAISSGTVFLCPYYMGDCCGGSLIIFCLSLFSNLL
jgi:hypothetical protein